MLFQPGECEFHDCVPSSRASTLAGEIFDHL
jgi:hypothetical protein